LIRAYARVSTDGQSVDAQVKQLRATSAEKVYRETASGAKTDRVQLRRGLISSKIRIPHTEKPLDLKELFCCLC
jgi:DNA invertase Pin-like site-specific DNA recombinase